MQNNTHSFLKVVVLSIFATLFWRHFFVGDKRYTLARTSSSVEGRITPNNSLPNLTSAIKPKLFYCGYPLKKLQSLLFPDFQSEGNVVKGMNSSPSDLILYGMHGDCIPGFDEAANYQYIEQNFKGTTILVNGEPNGNIVSDYPHLKTFYQLGGPVDDTVRTIKLFYVIIIFSFLKSYFQQQILGGEVRPAWNGKLSKMVYMQSHCVSYRQQAALELASVLDIDVPKGKCSVNHGNVNHVDIETLYSVKHMDWMDNWKVFENYKYCLVMENSKVLGYVTEKILQAFLGGCLPIYWGTEEVFEIFNERAFLYYEPGITIKEISYLELNSTAYKERASAPILAHGNTTVWKYLSLQDRIGGGILKKRIRTMLGIE